MGNWHDTNLNQLQCMYAATDAYVSIFTMIKFILKLCLSHIVNKLLSVYNFRYP
jgi:hypothetical protein